MDIQELQKQHYNSYVEVVKEIVRTNTNSLLENDIYPLFKEPPLDSMNQIKTKFLLTAKKEKLIVESEELNKMIEVFRKNIQYELKKIVEIRNQEIIDSFSIYINKNKDIKITKTELNNINKKIKKLFKYELNKCVDQYIIEKISRVFGSIKVEEFSSAKKELLKYFDDKGIYQKQILNNIDFKLLVKDTILINGIKEQTERYNFTLNNSRILNN